jgi:hypothetical protein
MDVYRIRCRLKRRAICVSTTNAAFKPLLDFEFHFQTLDDFLKDVLPFRLLL